MLEKKKKFSRAGARKKKTVDFEHVVPGMVVERLKSFFFFGGAQETSRLTARQILREVVLSIGGIQA